MPEYYQHRPLPLIEDDGRVREAFGRVEAAGERHELAEGRLRSTFSLGHFSNPQKERSLLSPLRFLLAPRMPQPGICRATIAGIRDTIKGTLQYIKYRK